MNFDDLQAIQNDVQRLYTRKLELEVENEQLRVENARLKDRLNEARDSLMDICDIAKSHQDSNFQFSRIVTHAEYGLHYSDALKGSQS